MSSVDPASASFSPCQHCFACIGDDPFSVLESSLKTTIQKQLESSTTPENRFHGTFSALVDYSGRLTFAGILAGTEIACKGFDHQPLPESLQTETLQYLIRLLIKHIDLLESNDNLVQFFCPFLKIILQNEASTRSNSFLLESYKLLLDYLNRVDYQVEQLPLAVKFLVALESAVQEVSHVDPKNSFQVYFQVAAGLTSPVSAAGLISKAFCGSDRFCLNGYQERVITSVLTHKELPLKVAYNMVRSILFSCEINTDLQSAWSLLVLNKTLEQERPLTFQELVSFLEVAYLLFSESFSQEHYHSLRGLILSADLSVPLGRERPLFYYNVWMMRIDRIVVFFDMLLKKCNNCRLLRKKCVSYLFCELNNCYYNLNPIQFVVFFKRLEGAQWCRGNSSMLAAPLLFTLTHVFTYFWNSVLNTEVTFWEDFCVQISHFFRINGRWKQRVLARVQEVASRANLHEGQLDACWRAYAVLLSGDRAGSIHQYRTLVLHSLKYMRRDHLFLFFFRQIASQLTPQDVIPVIDALDNGEIEVVTIFECIKGIGICRWIAPRFLGLLFNPLLQRFRDDDVITSANMLELLALVKECHRREDCTQFFLLKREEFSAVLLKPFQMVNYLDGNKRGEIRFQDLVTIYCEPLLSLQVQILVYLGKADPPYLSELRLNWLESIDEALGGIEEKSQTLDQKEQDFTRGAEELLMPLKIDVLTSSHRRTLARRCTRSILDNSRIDLRRLFHELYQQFRRDLQQWIDQEKEKIFRALRQDLARWQEKYENYFAFFIAWSTLKERVHVFQKISASMREQLEQGMDLCRESKGKIGNMTYRQNILLQRTLDQDYHMLEGRLQVVHSLYSAMNTISLDDPLPKEFTQHVEISRALKQLAIYYGYLENARALQDKPFQFWVKQTFPQLCSNVEHLKEEHERILKEFERVKDLRRAASKEPQ